MHAQIAHDLLDAVLREITVSAERPQYVVGGVGAGAGGDALGRRDLEAVALGAGAESFVSLTSPRDGIASRGRETRRRTIS